MAKVRPKSRPPVDPVDQAAPLAQLWRRLIGAPRDIQDPRIFHKVSLMALLAWVGLGADGLSSSAYGPAEAFKNLVGIDPTTGQARGVFSLAIFLALATAVTVFVISYAYMRVIEQFPHGGGGYMVATKLLGPRAGVVSGSALLVDYALTITTSVAAGGDALFNLLPRALRGNFEIKLLLELAALVALLVLNIRGVKESVATVLPIFTAFVATHLVLIGAGVLESAGRAPEIVGSVAGGLRQDVATFGGWGLFLIFVRAFSLGGGTFTGIEAVSNGLAIMREPKVHTGKLTMLYMASSLAFTAAGILVCYLLFDVQSFFSLPAREQVGVTLNGFLAERIAGGWSLAGLHIGPTFVFLTIASEAGLLFVAAQTGFIDGPRVMANMAVDSWVPRRFASLSDRLTSKDGVLLMGGASIVLLLMTGGSVDMLVVMYAVNVFATFSLTQLGMCRHWLASRRRDAAWKRHIAIHVVGLVLCVLILLVMVVEKFQEGAWKTLVITAGLVAACVWVRAHYRAVEARVRDLDLDRLALEAGPAPDSAWAGSAPAALARGRFSPAYAPAAAASGLQPPAVEGSAPPTLGGEPDPSRPTAILLVRGYSGMGIHMLLSLGKMFPGYYRNVLFVSAAVIDSGHFKGKEEMSALRQQTDEALGNYVTLARRLGWNSASASTLSTDPVDGLYRVCVETIARFPGAMVFGGKLIWKRESWWQRILHNETAYQVQRRLQWKGLAMTIIPLRTGAEAPPAAPGALPGPGSIPGTAPPG